MISINRVILAICVVSQLPTSFCRIHQLVVENDMRKYIALSTFGFYQGGRLNVQLQNFKADPQDQNAIFGFSLDRTMNDAMNPYLDSHPDRCLLQEPVHSEHEAAIIYFIMDLSEKVMKVNCSPEWNGIHIYKSLNEIPVASLKQALVGSGNILMQTRKKRDVEEKDDFNTSPCSKLHLPITVQVDSKGVSSYNTSFVMTISSNAEEGLYNLYFHNCPNYNPNKQVNLNFEIQITEENVGNFLSAGEMPLPALYCTMAVLFLLSGAFWVFLLRQSKHPVFKIHYLMAALVFLKALSLAFHGMNYHFIERLGVHLATWAVLYYIAHLLKGALLFVTLVLIGTGWTFIKHVLAPRDKRLFMAVIPLQVLANVAEIILEESEEGAREHRAWRDVFTLVDLLCCGCILFPVVWSIRHLQQASATDGKAATSLRKLKLFRHFYIMIVCYIYFTRIIVYLLRITVPFQYGWLDEMFREMATYVFFVLTGYKFRPAAHNPYFSLPQEEEENQVITESGITEGVVRVNLRNKSTPNLTEVSQQESEALLDQREGSHDYD
ncbi:hypothetical protein RN001_014459 [Aquatica leii]|uniref:GOST seven transmembrane domain-containing protein n=1 Tax=Aquatica leii TaxID=1421715 RepID=A0AAN7SN59_9COLE|nr:hypothetical protein RN001_014459 [Aquatica leii]